MLEKGAMLKTLDVEWKAIENEYKTLLETVNSFGEQLKDSVVGDRMIEFIPSTTSTQIENSFGRRRSNVQESDVSRKSESF